MAPHTKMAPHTLKNASNDVRVSTIADFEIDPNTDVVEFGSSDFIYTSKLLALDYDHTLVKPKDGKTFPANVADYEMLFATNVIYDTLKEYTDNGYCIVIFTNQSKPWKITQIKNVFRDDIQLPYKCFAGINKTHQKPSSTMFELYLAQCNAFISGLDYDKSLYVGDALGRKGDWSDSDMLFAVNCKLKYTSPEDFFVSETLQKSTFTTDNLIELNDLQELVVNVGYPASGKTTYSNQYKTIVAPRKHTYVVLHGDDLKTETKIKKSMKDALLTHNSVVIDATNSNKKKRQVFIELARKLVPNIHIKIIWFTTDISKCMERNMLREIAVPKIAFYMYRKHFEEPTQDEIGNYGTIIKVDN